MKRILVVSDDFDANSLICKTLSDAAYLVESVDNACSGLLHFIEKEYDIIISETFMPYFSGHELIKKIRQENQNINIIMLVSEKSNHIFNDEHNINAIIIKPIETDSLLNSIKAL
jgi:DNA-binding response OmpR family regulator